MNLAALAREQLHFLFDDWEDYYLLILVQDRVTTQVEHFNELQGRLKSQKVVNMLAFRFEDKANVCLVEDTLSSKVSLLDGLPDLLAFSSTTDEWSSFLDKFLDFMTGHVS